MKAKKQAKQEEQAARADTAHYVKTLKTNRQIARGKKLTPGATHVYERNAKGKKVLVRKRYSAT